MKKEENDTRLEGTPSAKPGRQTFVGELAGSHVTSISGVYFFQETQETWRILFGAYRPSWYLGVIATADIPQ